MNNSDNFRVNWRQAAGEALLLFLGVLLALGGQAWWEERVEKEARDEYIENLLLEVSENIAGLEHLIEQHDKYILAGKKILKQMQKGQVAAEADTILEQLQILSYFSDFRPATSALDNLISSGGYNSIESSSLRLAILKYARAIDVHNVIQTEQIDFFHLVFVPHISKSYPLLDIRFVRDVEGLPNQSTFKIEPTILIDSVEFENLVLRRISAEKDAEESAQSLFEMTAELQKLLKYTD